MVEDTHDVANYLRSRFGQDKIYLFPVPMNDDFFMSSIKFEIPFYIIQGIYDYQVSQVLAEKYLDALTAPKNDCQISPNMVCYMYWRRKWH